MSILKRGNGLFWTRNAKGDRLFYTSLRKLCVSLGTTPGHAVWAEWDAALTNKSFKSLCLGAFFARKPKTISRKVTSELFGCSRQTLRNWEKERGMTKERNMAVATPTSPEEWEWFSQTFGIHRSDPHVYHCNGNLYWQLPNTYHCDLPSAPSPSQATSYVKNTLSLEGAHFSRRRYWDDGPAAHRANGKGRTDDQHYVRTRRRLCRGGPVLHEVFFSSRI